MPGTERGRLSILRLILWTAAGIAMLAALWLWLLAPMLNREIADRIGDGDYRLIATDGSEFTQATLRRGGPSAVFFGFTHCPEVCPTTLADIALWQDELDGAADDLRVFFVTVDPERDTAEVLGDYVGWLPGAVGVTGAPDEVAKAVAAFKAYARKVPLEGGDYTMDHSAYVMLFDDRGRFFEPVAYQEDLPRVLDKLNRLLAG